MREDDWTVNCIEQSDEEMEKVIPEVVWDLFYKLSRRISWLQLLRKHIVDDHDGTQEEKNVELKKNRKEIKEVKDARELVWSILKWDDVKDMML